MFTFYVLFSLSIESDANHRVWLIVRSQETQGIPAYRRNEGCHLLQVEAVPAELSEKRGFPGGIKFHLSIVESPTIQKGM